MSTVRTHEVMLRIQVVVESDNHEVALDELVDRLADNLEDADWITVESREVVGPDGKTEIFRDG